MIDEMRRKLINAELNKIKNSKEKIFTIAKRTENQNTLIELGLTDKNVEEIILELELEDCISDFKEDKAGYPGHVFEFGKEIKGIEIYIKFRVLFENDKCFISCISFHEANYKIKYLFK